MPKFKCEYKGNGVDALVNALDMLGAKTTGTIKRAVYEGAHQVGIGMLAAIQSIPVMNDHYVPGDYPLNGITQEQKDGLLSSFGFAKMQDDGGFINTKCGFDGYNSVKTQKYPHGQPNALIANAVNSGTSRRQKYPFVAKGYKMSESNAIAAMDKQMTADLAYLLKE